MEPQKKIVGAKKELAPTSAMAKIRAFVSPGSTAGILRDRQKSIDEKLKKAGA
jgi:hypothetical protein